MKGLLLVSPLLLKFVYGRFTSLNSEEELLEPWTLEWFLCLGLCILLILGSGMVSGLTVGYLSIDSLAIDLKLKTGT